MQQERDADLKNLREWGLGSGPGMLAIIAHVSDDTWGSKVIIVHGENKSLVSDEVMISHKLINPKNEYLSMTIIIIRSSRIIFLYCCYKPVQV